MFKNDLSPTVYKTKFDLSVCVLKIVGLIFAH